MLRKRDLENEELVFFTLEILPEPYVQRAISLGNYLKKKKDKKKSRTRAVLVK